ncbi:hemolysin family protein [Engelhardtia mirabilis]|uniref:Hemolysin C n=1 Tax=Engelhardtia mirabilis TaxID=2528011 RepID=A0A518BJ57_9BACT|nr:Hemolysin C [Planctomycetes bacterium Pla133]QDV01336.1 Hemolysin C [Planctomycetes bacterium Pla86]
MIDAPLWLYGLLAGLLGASAVCSASETAFFSLEPAERARAGRATSVLHDRQRDFLVTVLLANLVINILYFAFADRLGAGLVGYEHLGVILATLLALLIVGEIMPKTVGLRGRLFLARTMAPFWLVMIGLVAPIRRPLVRLLEGVGRLVVARAGDERDLTPEELADVLERSAAEGDLLDHEADLIAEVVELRSIRVREIMTPRVDVIFVEYDGSNREQAANAGLAIRATWLPVVDGGADRVVGQVRVRDLFVHPLRSVAQLNMPVQFVPEVASALDLLRVLRDERTAEAVVVDEWGGTAGVVTIEDILEEIVGELRTEGEARLVNAVPLGEGVFRVPGGLSIRDWNEHFGHRVVPTEFETVGGFVTALMGRIPRAGDVVRFGGLRLEVHEVRGRRVRFVDIQVESEPAAGTGGPSA